MKRTPLFASLVLSLCFLCFTCFSLVSVTYAWFVSNTTSNSNKVGTGIIALKLYKTNISASTREEISPTNLFWSSETPLASKGAYNDFYINIVNEGNLKSEFSIGFNILSVNGVSFDPSIGEGQSEDNPADVIDVFYAEMEIPFDTANIPEQAALSDFIYLGTLSDIYYHDYRIRGVLNEHDKTTSCEKAYLIRLALPSNAQSKYSSKNVEVELNLLSMQYSNDLILIQTDSNDFTYGKVFGGGSYVKDSSVELKAIPESGYRFVKWDDDYPDAERRIDVMENETYTAIFEPDNYDVNLSTNNDAYGSVSGSGTYVYNEYASISATPNEGYLFLKWSDGNTSATRSLYMNKDYNLVATFIPLPVKGDLVYIGSSSEDKMLYRVLSMNGPVASLISMSDVTVSGYYSSSPVVVTFDSSNSISGIKYEGSSIDNYLENTFYESLPSSMKNSIVPSDISQKIIKVDTNSPSSSIAYNNFAHYLDNATDFYYSYGLNDVTIVDRRVFAPDVSELFNYFGQSNFTSSNIASTFFIDQESSSHFWTRSASSSLTTSAYAFISDGLPFAAYNYSSSCGVRACFNIDFTNCQFYFDINPLSS